MLARALALLIGPGTGLAGALGGWSKQSPFPTHHDLSGVAFATSGHGFVVGSYGFLAETTASVTVPAGATSASFTIGTRPVSTSDWVVLTATYDEVTRNTMFEVRPASDTVSITVPQDRRGKKQLRVEATSTSASVTLDAYVTATGAHIGRLSNLGGGKYGGQFAWPTNPQSITVRSSLGGSATKTVTLK